MDGEVEEKVLEVAGKQHNLITAEQALRLGVTRRMLDTRRANGRWPRLNQRVYCLSSTPPTEDQRDLAALLAMGDGAALARLSAAVRLKLDVPSPKQVQLIIPHERRTSAPEGCELYQARDLRADDVTRRGPFAVTRTGRTLLDLAACLDTTALRAALDSALRLNRENLSWAWTALQHHNRGHRGAAALRALLHEYRRDSEVPDSMLESLAQELCFVGGKRPFLHYAIADGEELVAEVDFAWPEVRLAIELDGYAYHATRRSFDADRKRDRRCALLDWQIHRFVWRDVRGAPDRFRTDLIRLYDVRRNRRGFEASAAGA